MTIKRTLCLVLFLVAANFLQAQTDKEKIQQIDQLLSGKFSAEAPGATVLVVRDGKVFFRKGYGLADLNARQPNTPETVFRIGSITKQFTAAAILRLMEQGKLSLQDEVTKFLPGYPTQGKKITIEHLLTHSSGIRSYTSLPSVMTKEAKAREVSVSDMIKSFRAEPMDFDPGDAYLYNNSGFFLLGAIIEQVSGETWGEHLNRIFFKPLKMKATFTNDTGIPGLATGYVNRGDYLVADYVHPSVPFAAGAILSTVDDLWKWNEAVFNNRVIGKESLAKALTPYKLNNGSAVSYGYGWQLGKLGDHKVIAHGGGIDGFLSFAMYVPDTKLFVALLHNAMSIAPEDLAYKVAGIAMGLRDDAPAVIAMDEAHLQEYVGVYQINAVEERIITREGTHLYSQRTGGTKYEIFPYATDAFFFADSPARLKFHRNASGSIEKLEVGGREYVGQVAKRTEKSLPARTATVVDAKVFDQYTGQYELVPGFIITVKRDGNKFMTQATGQSWFEIFPESDTKFFLKDVDAQLEFVRDESGTVNTVKLHQGGRITNAKRIADTAPKEKQTIALSVELLSRYTGEYELAPGFVLTIRREADKLMAQATGQGAAEIFPESETKFFYKVVDAQIEFTADAAGTIRGLKLFQGGNVLEGKKKQ